MRNWEAAERLVRAELAVSIQRGDTCDDVPLAIAVGGLRPSAVIAMGPREWSDDGVADLAMLASAFRPTRVLVALAMPREGWRFPGMVACCDVMTVADGVVECTRAWPWRRAGSRIIWPRIEAREWQTCADPLSRTAYAILDAGRSRQPAMVIRDLLAMSRAAGHRVHLAH